MGVCEGLSWLTKHTNHARMKSHQCPVCRCVKGCDAFLCAACTVKITPAEIAHRERLAARCSSAPTSVAFHFTASEDQRAESQLNDYSREIIARLKDERIAGKPVGYELVIICGAMPYRRERHWRGTEAAVRRKARMESHFREVESVTPYTSEQWNRAFGVPGLRL